MSLFTNQSFRQELQILLPSVKTCSRRLILDRTRRSTGPQSSPWTSGIPKRRALKPFTISSSLNLKEQVSASTGSAVKATLSLGAEDNAWQIPVLDLQFISATDPSNTTPWYSTEKWKVQNSGTVVGTFPEFPKDFGEPSAVLIRLNNKPDKKLTCKRFLVNDLVIDTPTGPVSFQLGSFIRGPDVQKERIFFNAKPYLPGKTPVGAKTLRSEELSNLRGEDPATGKKLPAATEERQQGERIYDYDIYNDLGDIHEDGAGKKDSPRPVLGGSPNPYPRRLRTGRPTKKVAGGSVQETLPHAVKGNPLALAVWLPDDEQFRASKNLEFKEAPVEYVGNAIPASFSGIFSAIPGIANDANDAKPDLNEFLSYSVYDQLFNDDTDDDPLAKERRHLLPVDTKDQTLLGKLKNLATGPLTKAVQKVLSTKFPEPAVRQNRSEHWQSDREFGRQALAGQNPCNIFRLIPKDPFLSGTLFRSEEASLDLPLPLDELISNGRIFGLDYDAGYRQYLEKVNIGEGRQLYAAKALLLHTNAGYLIPVGIQLATILNSKVSKEVETKLYTPGLGEEEWGAAKLVFNSLDSGQHQLISHWLRTHACVEPFIIALHRQLSAMHPVYKLMLPHCRYTLDINAEARSSLIHANGVIEGAFTPGYYSMELSALVYGLTWTFEGQDFEVDLIGRRMVKVDDKGEPLRVDGRLVPLIDYPYAQDGLDLYYEMRGYFEEYLGLYYSDTEANGKSKVLDDPEVQAWWAEVKSKGHPDVKTGWIDPKDIASLARILTIIAWTASAHHAAVNFGQYDYSAWMPNRPSLIRKPIPTSGAALQELHDKYERTVLTIISSCVSALKVMISVRILSMHMTDEIYLGDENTLLKDPDAKKVERRFLDNLAKVQYDITDRNAAGKSKIRSAGSPTSLPYTLLTPLKPEHYDVGSGLGRGVPTSISI
eukprot:jgi/Botrbrau1/6796/Bobra.0057s0028.1